MSAVVVTAEGISKEYGLSFVASLRERLRLGGRGPDTAARRFWALRDVSFELRAGQTLGVIGPNGAGKSTLLKILCGVTRATRGRFTVSGRTAPLIEVGAGFHPELSGRENIYLNAAILGMTAAEIRSRFDEIVAFSEIEDFLEMPVKKYSSGMFVRLGFSVAVHTRPDVLLIDEVLAVGDANFQRKCLGKLQEMLKVGCCLVMVSHSLMNVESVAETVLWLDHGRMQRHGPAPEVIGAYLEEMNRRFVAREREAPIGAEDPIILERLVLRNGAGEETDVVAAQDRLDLDLHYLARRRIERPFFWLSVSHVEHGNLFAISNIAAEDRTPSIEGRGMMRARIPALPLMPGVYEITGGVRDETAAVMLTPSRLLATFHVVMSGPGRVGQMPMGPGMAHSFSPVIVSAQWLGQQPP